jgi:predicted enzyme related to lactoylglutathione lyase
MGRPLVHFEVMGKDGEKLRSFYAELFDWAIDADNPLATADPRRAVPRTRAGRA